VTPPLPSVFVDTPSRLRRLFVDRLHLEAPAPRDALLTGGVLDSLQFVDLLAAIESDFGITIPLGDLDVERLDTLAALAELVDELRGPGHGHSTVNGSVPLD
jgi:acyl carrier protein